jgi:hypothetical protein
MTIQRELKVRLKVDFCMIGLFLLESRSFFLFPRKIWGIPVFFRIIRRICAIRNGFPGRKKPSQGEKEAPFRKGEER